MKLNWMPGEVLGSGHFAFSGTLMHLKPWPLYNLMAAKLFTSQCNAIDRHPQLRARASALATSILAIPFRLSASRTATFEIYAIPVLYGQKKKHVNIFAAQKILEPCQYSCS